MVPIFIFSLPRSGSTLLQRSLAGFPQIATSAEPWILLPLFFLFKRKGIYAVYGHRSLATAHEDLCKHMPRGVEGYHEAVRDYAQSIYGKLAKAGSEYFIDKTPRYHLIVEDIIAAFPDAKFVFLWRNPLAVAASLMQTWANGKWNLYRHSIDLYDGLVNLEEAFRKHEAISYALRYEDFVTDPDGEMGPLKEYLGIRFAEGLPEPIERPEGRLGDSAGAREFQAISAAPVERWKSSFRTVARNRWARRYLEWIGDERLATMGYSKRELMDGLSAIKCVSPCTLSDAYRMPFGQLYNLFEPHVIKDKVSCLLHSKRMYALK